MQFAYWTGEDQGQSKSIKADDVTKAQKEVDSAVKDINMVVTLVALTSSGRMDTDKLWERDRGNWIEY